MNQDCSRITPIWRARLNYCCSAWYYQLLEHARDLDLSCCTFQQNIDLRSLQIDFVLILAVDIFRNSILKCQRSGSGPKIIIQTNGHLICDIQIHRLLFFFFYFYQNNISMIEKLHIIRISFSENLYCSRCQQVHLGIPRL